MVLTPPPRSVKTVRDLIYWLYAELIADAAGFEGNYGFVVSRYKLLKSGEMVWLKHQRDYDKACKKGNVCVYCDAKEHITTDHIIPSSRAGEDSHVRELLESEDNFVRACRKCNSSKGDHDVFEWYDNEWDEIPRLVISKFLKLSYKLHETQGTLDSDDPNMDGMLDFYDIGVVITHLTSKFSRVSSK
jgi:hypothetical protein